MNLREAYTNVLNSKSDEEALSYYPMENAGRDELICILTQLMIDELGKLQELAERGRQAGLRISLEYVKKRVFIILSGPCGLVGLDEMREQV